jgi:hypothetical protein
MDAKEGAKQGLEWAKDRWADFRAESPYFQGKVGLAAAYALIVLFTIVLAPPRGDKWASAQERIPFGLAFKTALKITNQRNGDLDNVTVIVHGTGIEFDGKKTPGTWTTKPLSLPEKLEVKILTEQLYDKQGGVPPYSLVIDDAVVLDKKDHVIVTLHPKQIGTGGS